MSTLTEAFACRQNKEYIKAIQIYHPLWIENPEQFDSWAGWSYGFSLLKNRQYNEALEVCRVLHLRYPQDNVLNSLYGQCVYYTQFAKDPLPDIATLRKAAGAIFKLSPPVNKFSFAPRAIFKLVKVLTGSREIDWLEIESWLRKLDPDLLDEASFSMIGADGRKIEFASPVEEWYSAMIKTKAGLNQPQALLDLVTAARKRELKWHYGNDIWFARKEAFAYIQLGEKKKGEEILRNLILQKKDWFLLSDLAQVVEDREEALKFMARAAAGHGEAKLKISLFNNIFNILKDNSLYKKEAALHLVLIYLVRKENNWTIKDSLLEELQKRPTEKGTEHRSSKDICKILLPFWESLSKEKAILHHGFVDIIFENKMAGFIKSDKNRYFFSMKDTRGMKGKVEEGVPVVFELADGFDRKKGIAKKVAVSVRNR